MIAKRTGPRRVAEALSVFVLFEPPVYDRVGQVRETKQVRFVIVPVTDYRRRRPATRPPRPSIATAPGAGTATY